MSETRYCIELYVILPAAYQAAANAKFAVQGFGEKTFTTGLSATGNAPAQAYHACMNLRLSDLRWVKWLADNAPRAWFWIRVRTEYLPAGAARTLRRINDNFDLSPYKSLSWQTRTKGCVKIGTGPIAVSAALAALAASANPPITLKLLGTLP
jgi:hypothetical protein